VEDWEQFFNEKSRRRADVERRRARERALKTAFTATLVAALIATAVFMAG
jgi:hypothetical protein